MNCNEYQVQYLNNISFDPPEKMIMIRLGYHNQTTILNIDQKKSVSKIIDEGITICHPSAAYLRIPILKNTGQKIVFKNNEEIESIQLCKLLKKSAEMVLMASTVGTEIINKIEFEIKKNNGSKAVVFDAVGSEMADAVLDWLVNYLNINLKRESLILTKNRFSPGYGDLKLEIQKQIYKLLTLENLKLELTASMMLNPEKSVTAIAGLEVIE